MTSTAFLACLYSSFAAVLTKATQREFLILNDTFIKDGQQLQVISGRCVVSHMQCLHQILTVVDLSFEKIPMGMSMMQLSLL